MEKDLVVILPLVVLLVWALATLLIDLWIPKKRKGITALMACAGLALSLGIVLGRSGASLTAFNGMVIVDPFAAFLDVIFISSGLVGIALAYDYLKRQDIEHGEYYPLLMFIVAGMILITYAQDLIIIFLALELLSLPLYVLAGLARPKLESEEAALKYFLLGTFSSGFVLYGIALIFGATARTDLVGVVASLTEGSANPALFVVGAGLVLVGFAFKMAAVPFHMWLPDVYQGAPTSVTGFMAVATKAAGFAALMRVFVIAFPGIAEQMTPILWTLAALTMIAGNVLALAQTNIKRLLAYSSIANAGYLLVAFVPYGQAGVVGQSVASMLYYLAAYAITTFGAWAVVILLEGAEGKGLGLSDYAGLAKKYPWLAAAMLIFMLSFAGIPLTIGFWGKFYLFRTAILGGQVVLMYMKPGEPEAKREPWLHLVVAVMAAAVLLLSLVPGPLFELASKAVIF
jgi:NADH-quinone oxidoreductase subunit N